MLSFANEDSGVSIISKVGQFVLHKGNFSQMSFLSAPETDIDARRNQSQMR